MERCTTVPGGPFWLRRDLFAVLRWMARQGFVPVLPIEDSDSELTAHALYPAGWLAYGIRVPAGEKIHLRLTHPNEGWFRLVMVDKWGRIERGMLQNLIPTGNPEVTYFNLEKEARAVYVIVDDPGWMSITGGPFTVRIDRSWKPAPGRPNRTPVVTGIWALAKEIPAGDPAPEPEACPVPD